MPSAAAIALPADSPTSSEPTRPGLTATATAARSARATPARVRASSITGMIRSTWARDATSGTTPRHLAWSNSWLATTLDSTVRSRAIIAAAVSSHVVSIASSGMARRILPGRHDAAPCREARSPRQTPGDSGFAYHLACDGHPGSPNAPVSPDFRPGLCVKRARVHRLTAGHDPQLHRLTAGYDAQLHRLTAGHDPQLHRLTAGHDAQLHRLTAGHDARLTPAAGGRPSENDTMSCFACSQKSYHMPAP